MSSVHEVSGHRLTLLHNGVEYFPRLLAAIHAARHRATELAAGDLELLGQQGVLPDQVLVRAATVEEVPEERAGCGARPASDPYPD